MRGLGEPRRCRRLRHACQTALNVYDAPRAPSAVLETDGLPLILDECLDRIVDLTRLIEVRNKVERWLELELEVAFERHDRRAADGDDLTVVSATRSSGGSSWNSRLPSSDTTAVPLTATI